MNKNHNLYIYYGIKNNNLIIKMKFREYFRMVTLYINSIYNIFIKTMEVENK